MRASKPVISPMAAMRWSSLSRAWFCASQKPPVRRKPVAWPVSASNSGNSSVAYTERRVRFSEARSGPTIPAACQEVPLVS